MWHVGISTKMIYLENMLITFPWSPGLSQEYALVWFYFLIQYLWRQEIPLSIKLDTLIQQTLYLLEHDFNWKIWAWAVLTKLLQIVISKVLLLCQSLQRKKKKKKLSSNFTQKCFDFSQVVWQWFYSNWCRFEKPLTFSP